MLFFLCEEDIRDNSYIESVEQLLYGETTTFFSREDMEHIVQDMRTEFGEKGRETDPENLTRLFHENVIRNFHIIISLNAHPESFRYLQKTFIILGVLTVNSPPQ